MRNYLLAAVAAVALATPALARDGSPYVGVDAGFLLAEDFDQDVTFDDGTTSLEFNDGFTVDTGRGFDIDVNAGYDFGLFRAEGELGYKRLDVKNLRVNSIIGGDIGFLDDDDFDVSDNGSVWSLMANGLLDMGDENGLSAFAGLGIGVASVKFAGDSDATFAYQGIAGIRYALSQNIDLGLKYRYFRTGNVEFSDEFSDGVDTFGFESEGKLSTHSILASLTYNFAAPAPVVVAPVIAPPAPEPAPATQTCPDGTVILATDVCPAPPPAPAPERG